MFFTLQEFFPNVKSVDVAIFRVYGKAGNKKKIIEN